MPQNQFAAFIHKNLILTLIAVLLFGGGLSTLAFAVFNQNKNIENTKLSKTLTTSSNSASTASLAKSSSSISSVIAVSSSSSETQKSAESENAKAESKSNEKTQTTVQTSQSLDLQFKNKNTLKQFSDEELSCFGSQRIGEIGYKPGYGNSNILTNQLKNIKTIDAALSDKFLSYLLDGKLTIDESADLGKYENAGYALFGCSNYASRISKLIPVSMKNVDNVKAYLSFGSQGGLPNPTIEVYFKKENNVAKITKYPFDFKAMDALGLECDSQYGLKPETRPCYSKKVFAVLTDEYLQTKVEELVNLYAVE